MLLEEKTQYIAVVQAIKQNTYVKQMDKRLNKTIICLSVLCFAKHPVPAPLAVPILAGQNLPLGVFILSAEHSGAVTLRRAPMVLPVVLMGTTEAIHGRTPRKTQRPEPSAL